MASRTAGLPEELQSFVSSMAYRMSPAEKELRESTAVLPNADYQISPEQGAIIAFLLTVIRARRHLEIGVFTGYSALVAAKVLTESGRVVCCDVDADRMTTARAAWQAAGVAERIDSYVQDGETFLRRLVDSENANTFDSAFVDADKPNFRKYFEYCRVLVRPGGLILVDNLFRQGRITRTVDEMDAGTRVLHDLMHSIKADPELSYCIIPVGDGMIVVRNKRT